MCVRFGYEKCRGGKGVKTCPGGEWLFQADGLFTGEVLPALDDHVHIARVIRHGVALPAQLLASNQRRTAAAEQVQHGLAGQGAVLDELPQSTTGFMVGCAALRGGLSQRITLLGFSVSSACA